MQFLLVITVVLAVFFTGTNATLSNAVRQLVRPKLIKCANDWGVSQEELNKVIANDLSNTSIPLQCMSLCFYQSVGTMDSSGNTRVLLSKITFSLGENPCKVNRIVNKCARIKGANPCNTAYLLNKCYVDETLL